MGASLRRIYRKIRGGNLTLSRATGSVFLGLFIGLLPLYGLHLPLCLGLSIAFGLDGLLAYAAANISNPFFAPFIVLAEIETGSLIFTGKTTGLRLTHIKELGVSTFTLHSLTGAVVVAIVGASVGAALTGLIGLLLRRVRRTDPTRDALQRAISDTVARYRHVRPQDRNYVRLKLFTDPLTSQLAELDLRPGHVTDVGCGRGQFAFLLLALGKAQAVYGFDWDGKKIETAIQAANGAGHFVKADLRAPPFEPTDTLLVFDVLHYLAPEAQRHMLAGAYDALRPGGTLLLRDVDKNRGVLAAFTRFCERIGTGLGMNRSDQLVFRTSAEIRAELCALGFEPTPTPTPTPTLLDNQLWVFTKR